jgi:hypothetical protein
MLHPGQLRHLFEGGTTADISADSSSSSSSSSNSSSNSSSHSSSSSSVSSSGTAEYTVLHDEQAELTTRGVQVPASFFVARRALRPP